MHMREDSGLKDCGVFGEYKPPAGRDKGAEDGVEPDWEPLAARSQKFVLYFTGKGKLLMTVTGMACSFVGQKDNYCPVQGGGWSRERPEIPGESIQQA